MLLLCSGGLLHSETGVIYIDRPGVLDSCVWEEAGVGRKDHGFSQSPNVTLVIYLSGDLEVAL